MHSSLFLPLWVSLECHAHVKVTRRHPSLIGISKIYLYRFKAMENNSINPLHLTIPLNSLKRWNVNQRLKSVTCWLTQGGWCHCALLQFRHRVGSAPFSLYNLSYSVTHWEKSLFTTQKAGSEKPSISSLRIGASHIKFGDKHGNVSFCIIDYQQKIIIQWHHFLKEEPLNIQK